MATSGAENLFLTSPDVFDVERLTEVFSEHPGAFIVLDCFSDVFTPKHGIEQAAAMRHFVRGLRALYARYGCNGIIVDHPRRATKDEPHADYYGSIQKEAAFRVMTRITRLSTSTATKICVAFTCRKSGDCEPYQTFLASVAFADGAVSYAYDGRLETVTGAVQDGPSDVQRVEQVLENVPDGLKLRSIMTLTGLPEDRTRAALAQSKQIVVHGRARRTCYFLKTELGRRLAEEATRPQSTAKVVPLRREGRHERPSISHQPSTLEESSELADDSSDDSGRHASKGEKARERILGIVTNPRRRNDSNDSAEDRPVSGDSEESSAHAEDSLSDSRFEDGGRQCLACGIRIDGPGNFCAGCAPDDGDADLL
jgi:hypothetical protein